MTHGEVTDSAGITARYTPLRKLRKGEAVVGSWKPYPVVDHVEISGVLGRVHYTDGSASEWVSTSETFPVYVSQKATNP